MRGTLAAAVVLLAAPTMSIPTAGAAPPTATGVLTGSTLTITGTASAETFTVSESAGVIQVVSPVFSADPDGAGSACALTNGTTIVCADSAVTTLVVNALGGTDTITDTRVSSGDDQDTLNGGDSADTITYHPTTFGPLGRTITLNGGDGADTLTYVPGATFNTPHVVLDGGNDGDTLTKNTFDDPVLLTGGPGSDTLNGGTGGLVAADTGGDGDDFYNGGPDGDFFQAFADPGADTYDGGPQGGSADTLSYAGVDTALNLSLTGVGNDGRAGEHDTIVNIELLRGGNGPDTITGGPGNDLLFGANGNDRIDGAGGNDEVHGSAGTDVISGGTGGDKLFGEEDNDEIQTRDGAKQNDQTACGTGTDVVSHDDGDGADIDCETSLGPPVLTVAGASKAKGKHATITVSCPATAATACQGHLVLSAKLGGHGHKAGARPIGTADFSIGAGTTSVVQMKLSKKARALLGKKGKLKATATLASADALSPLPETTIAVLLKGKKKKH
jgi:Ca2+-binding RTX toxin-like protein